MCVVSIQFQIMFSSQSGWVLGPNTELQMDILTALPPVADVNLKRPE